MAPPGTSRPSGPSGPPVAVDAMGGDKAPGEIVAGARQARDTLGVRRRARRLPDLIGDTLGLPVIEASEVIGMDEDPGPAGQAQEGLLTRACRRGRP